MLGTFLSNLWSETAWIIVFLSLAQLPFVQYGPNWKQILQSSRKIQNVVRELSFLLIVKQF